MDMQAARNMLGYYVRPQGYVFKSQNSMLTPVPCKWKRDLNLAFQTTSGTWFAVDRVLAETYLGWKSRRKWFVKHKDNNFLNNKIENLEWLAKDSYEYEELFCIIEREINK